MLTNIHFITKIIQNIFKTRITLAVLVLLDQSGQDAQSNVALI